MKKLFLLFLGLALTAQVLAQEAVRITGTVISSEENTPLPGVTVLQKDTNNGTITDVEGGYSILVSRGEVLVFSYLGYVAEEVLIENQSVIGVSLTPGIETLSEVTVTALGIKRETRSLGYAVAEIGNEQIAGTGEQNPIASLAGKLAGVDISSTTAGPTGSNRVIIRGIRELQGNNQPLYVIDGVPAVNGNIGSADHFGGFDLGDGLADINPNDIASISVLKGASAAALYGSRALNGVILITTKSGKVKKGLGIEYNASFTVDQISTRLDERQKTYGQGNNGVFPTDPLQSRNITSNWGPRFTDHETITQIDGTVRPYEYLENNVQDFFRDGHTWMHNLAVTGGTEEHNIRFSYSNVTNNDIIPKSGLSKNNIGINGQTKISDKLTISGKATLMSESVTNRPALTDNVNNIGNGLIGLAANFDQAWLQNYETEDGRYIDYTGNVYRANPYWTLNRTRNESSKERISGLIQMDYKFNDLFTLNVLAGTDFFTFTHENFYDKYTPSSEGGLLNILDMTVREDNVQGYLTFQKSLSEDFRVSASAGGNFMQFRRHGRETQGSEIIAQGESNLLNFGQIAVFPFDFRKEIQSVFGTAEISFREYVYLNFQGRNDWASTLSPGKVSYFYPSADLSVVFTDMFNIQSKVVSFGKIRASLGQVGSDFDPYKTTFAYSLTGRSLRGQPMGNILGSTIPNADLLPQIKTSFEIGTDIRMFNDRLSFDVTYYNEVTDDVLMEIPVPETTGFQFAALNAGKLKNHGIEVLVNATPVNIPDGFRWDLSVNYAKNINEVVEMHEGLETFTVAEARWAGATIVAEKGKPFGTILGNDFLLDEDGNRVHNSSNGMPMPTEQPQVIGNSLPDWMGGASTTLSYKGLSLRAVFDVRIGGDIFSMTNMTMHSSGAHSNTEAGRDSWNEYNQERAEAEAQGLDPNTVEQNGRGYVGVGVNEQGEVNDIAVNPSQYWATITNNIPAPFVYDASYIKLRDLGLTYSFPKSMLRGLPIQNVNLSLIGRNLFILMKNVPNIDPESNYNTGNGQGFEYGSLPRRRQYGVNLTITL